MCTDRNMSKMPEVVNDPNRLAAKALGRDLGRSRGPGTPANFVFNNRLDDASILGGSQDWANPETESDRIRPEFQCSIEDRTKDGRRSKVVHLASHPIARGSKHTIKRGRHDIFALAVMIAQGFR